MRLNRRVAAIMSAYVVRQLKTRLNARCNAIGATDWPESTDLDTTDPSRPVLVVVTESGYRIEIPFDLYPAGSLQ